MDAVGEAEEEVCNEDEDDVSEHGFSLEDVFEPECGFVPEVAFACLSISSLDGRWDVDEHKGTDGEKESDHIDDENTL